FGINVLRFAAVFNVADHSAAYVRNISISVIIDRNNLDAGPALPHVAGHLPDELRKDVDDVARAPGAHCKRLRCPLVMELAATEAQILIRFLNVALFFLPSTLILK